MRELLTAHQSPEVLAWVSQRATSAGDAETDVHARLLLILALCARGAWRDAEALISRAEEDAFGIASLKLERAMARAALGRSGALQELEVALRGRNEVRGAALLAEGLSRLGAWERADAAWAMALESAPEHERPALALRRAENLVNHGRNVEAVAAAQPALGGTQLVQLAACLLLGGLYLELGEPDAAMEVAMVAGQIAESRRNWYALSAAAMDAAMAWRMKGHDQRGVQILHATLTNIRQQGDPGVLLMARLVELQQEQRLTAERD